MILFYSCSVLNAVNTFQQAIESSINASERQFITEKLAVVIVDQNPSNFNNTTLFVDVDDNRDTDLDSVNVIVQSNMTPSFNASIFLPASLIEEGHIEADFFRIAFAVFSSDVFFQSHVASQYGPQIMADNLTVGPIIVSASLFSDMEDLQITDLNNPVVIEFRKPKVCISPQQNCT